MISYVAIILYSLNLELSGTLGQLTTMFPPKMNAQTTDNTTENDTKHSHSHCAYILLQSVCAQLCLFMLLFYPLRAATNIYCDFQTSDFGRMQYTILDVCIPITSSHLSIPCPSLTYVKCLFVLISRHVVHSSFAETLHLCAVWILVSQRFLPSPS